MQLIENVRLKFFWITDCAHEICCGRLAKMIAGQPAGPLGVDCERTPE